MVMRVGTIDFLTVACYIIIFGFLWRATAAALSDRSLGKAMAYIF